MKPITVIVADAQRDSNTFLCQQVLSQVDMRLIGTARDGAEALELVQRLKPDVLIMDVVLRRIDGPEVLKQMNELGISTGVIFVTHIVHAEIERALLELGAMGVYRKTDDIKLTFAKAREVARKFDPAGQGRGDELKPEDDLPGSIRPGGFRGLPKMTVTIALLFACYGVYIFLFLPRVFKALPFEVFVVLCLVVPISMAYFIKAMTHK